MPTCVEGHQSTTADYCDVCGAAIGAAATVAAPQPVPAPDPQTKSCPACGMPVVGRFCEACGHDSALPAPPQAPAAEAGAEAPAPAAWSVIVVADQDFYERVIARDGPDTVPFPDFFPPRRIALTGATALIGRSKPQQGIEPEIDLGVQPADRGVSSQHAVLRIGESGITITDLGSTNGTSLNGSEELLAAHQEVPLSDGDRIHVGAWTTIMIAKAK